MTTRPDRSCAAIVFSKLGGAGSFAMCGDLRQVSPLSPSPSRAQSAQPGSDPNGGTPPCDRARGAATDSQRTPPRCSRELVAGADRSVLWRVQVVAAGPAPGVARLIGESSVGAEMSSFSWSATGKTYFNRRQPSLVRS